jgi:hypothetical protein
MLAYAALAVLPLEESILDGVLDGDDVPAGFRGRPAYPTIPMVLSVAVPASAYLPVRWIT